MHNKTNLAHLQARRIQIGEYHLIPEHQVFVRWIVTQFNVAALDFLCETRQNSKGHKQQLVHIILETEEDAKRLGSESGNNKLIAQQFLVYLQSTESVAWKKDLLKADVFPIDNNPYPNTLITYRPLEYIDMKVALEMMNTEKRSALSKYPDVWTISQSVVFYNTDEQIKKHEKDGTSQSISNELQQIVKRYNELGYADFNSIDFRFDSKESFQRDYEGNWYYYWK